MSSGVPTAPTFRQRVELLIVKFGQRTCRHTYTLMVRREGLQLRCTACGHETEMFRIAGTKN